MKRKTTVAAIALCLTPTLSLAMGCSDGEKQTTASSCMEGMVWDEAKGNCVLKPSS